MNSKIFIGAPGVGKTHFSTKHFGKIIDPETSMDWKTISKMYESYLKKNDQKIEFGLDWPAIWVEEVLPRLLTALIVEKDIAMGMITPTNVEIVRKFLKPFTRQTALIMPNEKKHYAQVVMDSKRPQTWGPESRGWQNTFWTRMLLLGLATELGLEIVEEPVFTEKSKQLTKRGLKAREVIFEGKTYLEVLTGCWAELDESDEIVAIYDEISGEKNEVVIQCNRKSRSCGSGLHDCGKNKILKKDVNGVSLTDWIPQDKLKPLAENKKNAIIFFAGTFAPYHHGHNNAMEQAKLFLEADGWNVVGGYVSNFMQIREGRVGSLNHLLGSSNNRNAMMRLGVMDSNWIMADLPTQHVLDLSLLKQGKHPTQLIASRLRSCGALEAETPVTTFWLNGKDAFFKESFYGEFGNYADAVSMNPLRMIIMDNRQGENLWDSKKIAESLPSLLPFINYCTSQNKNSTSATEVREALMAGNRAMLEDKVGISLVESFLIAKMSNT